MNGTTRIDLILLAKESGTMPACRQRLLNATEADTLIDAYRQNEIEPLAWPLQGMVVEDIFRAAMARGEADYFRLQAGQALRMLKADQSAAEIIAERVAEAQAVISRLHGLAD